MLSTARHHLSEDICTRGEFSDSIREEYSIAIFEQGSFLRRLSKFVKEPLFINATHWTIIEFKIIGNIYEIPQEYQDQFKLESIEELEL